MLHHATTHDHDRQAQLATYDLLGHGDLALGLERFEAWRALFFPAVPTDLRTHYAVCTIGGRWRRRSGSIPWGTYYGHFNGDVALGALHVGPTAVSVLDIDNRAGKAACSVTRRPERYQIEPVPRDPDLLPRLRLAALAQPQAFVFRSSLSGGFHLWTFLDQPHPQRIVAELGRLRLRTVQPDLDQRQLALELHPNTQVGTRGATIRVPFGPGSALLDQHGRPLHDTAGDGIRLLVEQLAGRRLSLYDAFRAPYNGPPPFDGPVPAQPGLDRGGRPTADAQWHRLLDLCSGHTSPYERPSRYEYSRLTRHLWAHGLPALGTRHQATFLLALDCKWQGLSDTQATHRITSWGRSLAAPRSTEWDTDPRSAEDKTASVVKHVYHRRARTPRRPRLRTPAVLVLEDLLNLELDFPNNPAGLDMAIRVLRLAKANRHKIPSRFPALYPDRWVCEIPMEAVGARTRRGRRAFAAVHDSGIIRLYSPRIAPQPWRPADHPDGPQRGRRARAAIYTINWTFADAGSPVTRRRPITSAARSHLARAQRASLAPDTKVGTCPSAFSVVAVVRQVASKQQGPVGAVERRSRSKALWTRRCVQGACGQETPVKSVLRSLSTAPSGPAASIGQGGVGGSGGDRGDPDGAAPVDNPDSIFGDCAF